MVHVLVLASVSVSISDSQTSTHQQCLGNTQELVNEFRKKIIFLEKKKKKEKNKNYICRTRLLVWVFDESRWFGSSI